VISATQDVATDAITCRLQILLFNEVKVEARKLGGGYGLI
jgi:hypothetical protein